MNIYALRDPENKLLYGFVFARTLDELRMRFDEVEELDDSEYAEVPRHLSFAIVFDLVPPGRRTDEGVVVSKPVGEADTDEPADAPDTDLPPGIYAVSDPFHSLLDGYNERLNWHPLIPNEATRTRYMVRTYAQGPADVARIQELSEQMGMGHAGRDDVGEEAQGFSEYDLVNLLNRAADKLAGADDDLDPDELSDELTQAAAWIMGEPDPLEEARLDDLAAMAKNLPDEAKQIIANAGWDEVAVMAHLRGFQEAEANDDTGANHLPRWQDRLVAYLELMSEADGGG